MDKVMVGMHAQGKTTLAIAFAHQLWDREQVGCVCYADLRGMRHFILDAHWDVLTSCVVPHSWERPVTGLALVSI